jgi:hypothetical protein
MSVEYKSHMEEVQAMLKERRAKDLNEAAKQHLAWADFRVPVKTGSLQKTLRQTEFATPDNLRAVVNAGGMSVLDTGITVNYAAAVNFGSHHATFDIPPDPFWTEAEEVGKDTIKRRATNHKRDDRARKQGKYRS